MSFRLSSFQEEMSGLEVDDGFRVKGWLFNKNTIEDFKNANKGEILSTIGDELWDAMENGAVEQNPSLLVPFVVLTFGDLKLHKYLYWFAFPVLNVRGLSVQTPATSSMRNLLEVYPSHDFASLKQRLEMAARFTGHPFFLCKLENNVCEVLELHAWNSLSQVSWVTSTVTVLKGMAYRSSKRAVTSPTSTHVRCQITPAGC